MNYDECAQLTKFTTSDCLEVWFTPETEETDKRAYYLEECEWSEAAYKKHALGGRWFSAKVEIKKRGFELAVAYLGCCHYASFAEFYNAPDGYFQDITGEAIDEAREVIKQLAA